MEYAFTSEEKDVREAGRRFIDDHTTEDGWSEEDPGRLRQVGLRPDGRSRVLRTRID